MRSFRTVKGCDEISYPIYGKFTKVVRYRKPERNARSASANWEPLWRGRARGSIYEVMSIHTSSQKGHHGKTCVVPKVADEDNAEYGECCKHRATKGHTI